MHLHPVPAVKRRVSQKELVSSGLRASFSGLVIPFLRLIPLALDLLTDALVLVGQHGVYCQSARQPGMPAMDIQMISHCLTDAKELVASVIAELQRKRSESL